MNNETDQRKYKRTDELTTLSKSTLSTQRLTPLSYNMTTVYGKKRRKLSLMIIEIRVRFQPSATFDFNTKIS